ncbi:MAG: endolytic transglycosylase MltG [Gammaproteobacteria bacterium]|nr:endolytic transglycosylase MltG [Gammaproteobacteria bacterium]
MKGPLDLRWSLRAFITCLAAVLISCSGISLLFLYQAVRSPIKSPDQFLMVPVGEGLAQVARRFVGQGMISERWPIMAWGVLSGISQSLQAGEYLVETGMTPAQVLGKISRGEIFERKVTLVEGLTFHQMLGVLKKAQRLDRVLPSTSADAIRTVIGHPFESLEASFYPDTYHYGAGDSDIELLARASSRMKKVSAEVWARRAPDIAISSSHEAIILASIIQKEAMRAEEMPIISSVLHNRLKLGMRLQVDPTVIYGLGPDFKGKLKRRHLRKDNPYNTYTRDGLPPGPISAPGQDALLAAVQPHQTAYLYFVAKGDGTHYFSKTLQEHNRAVRKYIK